MMSADELFSMGRLLPYKGSNKSQMQRGTTTLRDELLVEDREDDVSFHRPPKGSSTRWKGLLGWKRTAHIGSKKAERGSDGSSMEGRRSGLVHESSSSQELKQLSDEIRLELSSIMLKTRKSLKASLAIAELTIAIHHVFHAPVDKIIWDAIEQQQEDLECASSCLVMLNCL